MPCAFEINGTPFYVWQHFCCMVYSYIHANPPRHHTTDQPAIPTLLLPTQHDSHQCSIPWQFQSLVWLERFGLTNRNITFLSKRLLSDVNITSFTCYIMCVYFSENQLHVYLWILWQGFTFDLFWVLLKTMNKIFQLKTKTSFIVVPAPWDHDPNLKITTEQNMSWWLK